MSTLNLGFMQEDINYHRKMVFVLRHESTTADAHVPDEWVKLFLIRDELLGSIANLIQKRWLGWTGSIRFVGKDVRTLGAGIIPLPSHARENHCPTPNKAGTMAAMESLI